MKSMNTNVLVALVAVFAAWFHYDQNEKGTYVATDVTKWAMAASGVALLYVALSSKNKGSEMMIVAASGGAAAAFAVSDMLQKKAEPANNNSGGATSDGSLK